MSHSDCAVIECAERDGTYITLSCVLFSMSQADIIAYIASFAYFTKPDDLSPQLIRINEGLLYNQIYEAVFQRK
jgi:hypothetical protein